MSYVIPDVAEHITAYRWWRTTPLLTSLSFQVFWGSEMTAKPCHEMGNLYNWSPRTLPRCNGPVCTGSPGLAHGCGIYALNTLSSALFCPDIDGKAVLGKVLLAGKVHPYEQGYRAEKAKIAGLYPAAAFKQFEQFFDGPYPRIASGVEVLAMHYKIPLLDLTPDEHKDVHSSAERYYVSRMLSHRYWVG